MQISKSNNVAPPTLIVAEIGQNQAISTTTAREYVLEQAKNAGVNPIPILFILDHESQDGSRMRGDDGNSRGYFQISSIYHPEVSDSCADSLPCSTAWTIKQILTGRISEWSTWRLRCKIYQDAPDCE